MREGTREGGWALAAVSWAWAPQAQGKDLTAPSLPWRGGDSFPDCGGGTETLCPPQGTARHTDPQALTAAFVLCGLFCVSSERSPCGRKECPARKLFSFGGIIFSPRLVWDLLEVGFFLALSCWPLRPWAADGPRLHSPGEAQWHRLQKARRGSTGPVPVCLRALRAIMRPSRVASTAPHAPCPGRAGPFLGRGGQGGPLSSGNCPCARTKSA